MTPLYINRGKHFGK